jgi:hypothetical protein
MKMDDDAFAKCMRDIEQNGFSHSTRAVRDVEMNHIDRVENQPQSERCHANRKRDYPPRSAVISTRYEVFDLDVSRRSPVSALVEVSK